MTRLASPRLTELLVNERRVRGVNQREMAQAIKAEVGGQWSQPKLSRLENGQSPSNVDDLRRLARFLHVPLGELVCDAEMSDTRLDSDVSDLDLGLLSEIVRAAERLRALGDPHYATVLLDNTRRRIEPIFSAPAASLQERRAYANVSLGLALTRGDITADRDIRHRTLRHTTEALRLLDRPEFASDDLLFRAVLRHGNELRKAGASAGATAYLRRADKLGRGTERETAVLVPLARAYLQLGDYAEAETVLRRMQDAIEDGLPWTPGFHDVAVLHTELRLALLSPRKRLPPRTEIRDLINRAGVLPPRDAMAPQWRAIWAVSVCAYAVRRRELDLAEQTASQAMPEIQRRGMIRQQHRLHVCLAAIERRDTNTGLSNLRALSRTLLSSPQAPD